ncbi:hypothetical protein EDB86DRAFT_2954503 [Lactarius hatsudake]|nr:hypothetical protein EDB86DRAFT_2954503 [Lactarius hatsudake]
MQAHGMLTAPFFPWVASVFSFVITVPCDPPNIHHFELSQVLRVIRNQGRVEHRSSLTSLFCSPNTARTINAEEAVLLRLLYAVQLLTDFGHASVSGTGISMKSHNRVRTRLTTALFDPWHFSESDSHSTPQCTPR